MNIVVSHEIATRFGMSKRRVPARSPTDQPVHIASNQPEITAAF